MEVNKKIEKKLIDIQDKSIYISGKISGLKLENYLMLFTDREKMLKNKFKKVINPLKIYPLFGINLWFFYMISDLKELYKCDYIYMMKNYKLSRGAKIELFFAKLWDKNIIFEK